VACRLADAGLSLQDIASMHDDDLLAIPRIGQMSIMRLREYIASQD
jgi:hypothetical protein